MKKKKFNKKLSLNKEKISDLSVIKGGGGDNGTKDTCFCSILGCPPPDEK